MDRKVVIAAKKSLVLAVSSVKPTHLIEIKAEELSKISERARTARFLGKYRRAEAIGDGKP